MAATLILGGVKSGKSRFGEQLLTQHAPALDVLSYIATSVPYGDEMSARIEKHKKQRVEDFSTIEVQYNFSDATQQPGSDLVARLSPLVTQPQTGILVECMATWLGGMLSFCDDVEQALQHYYNERQQLLELVKVNRTQLVIISNEVGMGLIGASQLERCYADEMGLLNQALGTVCEQVIQVSAGFPLYLKQR